MARLASIADYPVREHPVPWHSHGTITRTICSPQSGVSLVEVAISVAMLAIVAATTVQTLLVFNRKAAATRVFATAKEVVQRNIEGAMGGAFDSTTTPPVLAITAASGAIWDDDGGDPNTVSLLSSRDGSRILVSGTLRRIVTSEPNTLGADLRRVTFRVNYSVYKRPVSYEITTIRARDK